MTMSSPPDGTWSPKCARQCQSDRAIVLGAEGDREPVADICERDETVDLMVAIGPARGDMQRQIDLRRREFIERRHGRRAGSPAGRLRPLVAGRAGQFAAHGRRGPATWGGARRPAGPPSARGRGQPRPWRAAWKRLQAILELIRDLGQRLRVGTAVASMRPLEGGLEPAPDPPVGIAQMVVDGCIGRLQRHGTLQFAHGILVTAKSVVGPAEAVDDVAVLGTGGHGGAHHAERLVETSRRGRSSNSRDSSSTTGCSGFHLQCLAEVLLRRGPLAGPLAGDAAVIVKRPEGRGHLVERIDRNGVDLRRVGEPLLGRDRRCRERARCPRPSGRSERDRRAATSPPRSASVRQGSALPGSARCGASARPAGSRDRPRLPPRSGACISCTAPSAMAE